MPQPPTGFLQALSAEGYSGRDALQTLRDAGYNFQTQAFYRTWGAVQASQAAVESAEATDLDVLPTFGSMTPAPIRMQLPFTQRVVIQLTNRTTGAITSQIMNIPTDELMTHAEAIDVAGDLFGDYGDVYDQDVSGGYYLGTWYRSLAMPT